MPFIKIYPLTETEPTGEEDFGRGNPARCRAERGLGAREYFLNIAEISMFEECPLYILSQAETDALVNGIRLRLRSGEILVVPDDPEDEAHVFARLLERAARGEVVEMPFSRYLRQLEQERLI